MSTSNHQIVQQWVDYWNWSPVAGGVERTGYQPETHTPLLYPGEVYAGAVLPAHLRVAAAADGAAYAIEHTPSPALYHPTTLYRMGLIGPESVPDLLVFERQGQFGGRDGISRQRPEPRSKAASGRPVAEDVGEVRPERPRLAPWSPRRHRRFSTVTMTSSRQHQCGPSPATAIPTLAAAGVDTAPSPSCGRRLGSLRSGPRRLRARRITSSCQ